jgi:hypothetical protein
MLVDSVNLAAWLRATAKRVMNREMSSIRKVQLRTASRRRLFSSSLMAAPKRVGVRENLWTTCETMEEKCQSINRRLLSLIWGFLIDPETVPVVVQIWKPHLIWGFYIHI